MKKKSNSVKEAIQRVVKQDINSSKISVPLNQSTGHILASDVVATYDIPRFNKSPYDGFAIRSQDSIGASGENRVHFKVIDHIGAGSVSDKKLVNMRR